MEPTVFAKKQASRSPCGGSKPGRSRRCRSKPRSGTSGASASTATISAQRSFTLPCKESEGKLASGFPEGAAQETRHFLLEAVEHGFRLCFRLGGLRGFRGYYHAWRF